MTKKTKNSAEIERLELVLAVYGADSARWPAGERSGLESFVRTDASANRLLNEAVALEKVMGFAPAGAADEALRQRIVAAAVADDSREARVVPIGAARKREHVLGSSKSTLWPASAMAACFAVGLYLGLAGLGANMLGTALDLASLDISAEETEAADFFSDNADGESEGLI